MKKSWKQLFFIILSTSAKSALRDSKAVGRRPEAGSHKISAEIYV